VRQARQPDPGARRRRPVEVLAPEQPVNEAHIQGGKAVLRTRATAPVPSLIVRFAYENEIAHTLWKKLRSSLLRNCWASMFS